jgi:hypothetical protein
MNIILLPLTAMATTAFGQVLFFAQSSPPTQISGNWHSVLLVMRQISLTKGMTALIDDEDFEWASRFTWWAVNLGRKGENHWYAATNVGGRKNKKTLLMHREIAARAGLPWSPRYDLRDRNGLNNQRVNLRPATATLNNANSKKRLGTTSRFKGVSWESFTGRWRAQIRNAGKSFSLGRFADEIEAAKAYDAAAREQFGEFALTNFSP